jgi:hypothetical protein
MNYLANIVSCELCSYKWVAVYPEETNKLECTNCNNITEVKIVEHLGNNTTKANTDNHKPLTKGLDYSGKCLQQFTDFPEIGDVVLIRYLDTNKFYVEEVVDLSKKGTPCIVHKNTSGIVKNNNNLGLYFSPLHECFKPC